MGQLLSTPITEKKVKIGENHGREYGIATMHGWRRFMEDAHAVDTEFTNERMQYFAVFDGHSGGEMSEYCARHLGEEIAKTYEKSCDLPQSIKQAFQKMDRMVCTPEGQEELQRLGRMNGLESDDPELENRAETLGRFLIERAKRKRREHELFMTSLRSESNDSSPLDSPDQAHFTSTVGDEQEHHDDTVDQAEAPRPVKLQRSRSLTLDNNQLLEVGRGRAIDLDKSKEFLGELSAPVPRREPPATVPAGKFPQKSSRTTKNLKSKSVRSSAGTTAVALFIHDGSLYCGNAGDSRCVLSRGGRAVELSFDHKPENPEELIRIENAGGRVVSGRINGTLNLSRAIGDIDFKQNRQLSQDEQLVVSLPDIVVEPIQEEDEFVVLACDGIWEVMSNQEVVQFVRSRLRKEMRLEHVMRALLDTCLAESREGHNGSGLGLDNMTLIVVRL